MKVFVLILICALFWPLSSLRGQSLLDTKVQLDQKKTARVQDVLEQITLKTGILFSYSSNNMNLKRRVKFQGDEKNVGDYLKKALERQKVQIRLKKGKIILVPSSKIIIPKRVPVEKVTFSGFIKDATSHEALIGATLYDVHSLKGTTTNAYGFFSLSLKPGVYDFIISYVGYKSRRLTIDLTKNVSNQIYMNTQNEIGEVVVNAFEKINFIDVNRMSSSIMPVAKMKTLPVLMGEKDIVRTIKLYPGIQSGGNTGGLFVRGGGADQNLILLDGVPLYNSNHLLGFLSVFSGTAVNNAEFIKGGFPARYGGRLSSVVDVRMKEGDMNNYHGEISLGFVAGKVRLEGPLVKGKTSFHVSARRTWADLFLKRMFEDSDIKANYQFYDFYAKVNHKFSSGSRLYMSYYRGYDDLRVEDKESFEESKPLQKSGMGWGNRIASLRWNNVISSKLFSNTTLTYSKYKYRYSDFYLSDRREKNPAKLENYDFNSRSDIEDFGFRNDFDLVPSPQHYIKFGAGYVRHLYKPKVYQEYNSYGNRDIYEQKGSAQQYANEFFIYGEDDIRIGNNLKINPGIHFAGFNVNGKTYLSLQPRLSAMCKVNELSSLKLSYSKMSQFIHLLSNPGIGQPSDLWVPSTKRIKPERSDQIALGFSRVMGGQWELTIEAYNKWMKNLIDYRTTSLYYTSNKGWEDKVEIGKGRGYGMEFMIEKKKGKTTGWFSYTLAYSNRQFDKINFGRKFRYRYDRRHDVSLAVTHKHSERLDFGLVYIYASGNAITLGLDRYRSIDNLLNNSSWGTIQNVEKRNNYQLPDYHRLDIAANFRKQKSYGQRTWSVGVYNAYNRRNPFMYYLDNKENGSIQLNQVSLSPIIPYVSWSLSF